jgi:hypothetical protein
MGQNGFFAGLGKFHPGTQLRCSAANPVRCAVQVLLEFPCGCADTERCVDRTPYAENQLS